MKIAASLACGLVFAIGLGFSGMLRPEKIIGFLEFRDPSLLLVMAPAMGIYTVAAWRRRGPQQPVDLPLVVGAAIFGIGWGMTGICPGPAVVNLARPNPFFLAFMAALLGGMALRSVVRRRRADCQ